MSRARVLLIAVCLAALMVPFAYAINFIGPINYVASHGGNVTFAQNFQATSLTYPGGLNRFTNLVWGGTLRGNLGFDAAATANMTVTQIGQNTVAYTVTTLAPGAVHTYLYYDMAGTPRPSRPTSVTGGTYTYDDATRIATITTTGSPVAVVVAYSFGGVVTTEFFSTITMLIWLIPFIAGIVIWDDRSKGELGKNTLVKVGLVVFVLVILIGMLYAMGY